MTHGDVLKLISQGESTTVEFKESKTALSKDVYESVCAFLNRHGGHILLGIRDDGEIVGVNSDKIENIKKDFLTSINNPQKLNPPFYLSADTIEIEGKNIVHIYVPESSSVHSTNGKIFDRGGDGDFDITGRNDQIAQLYLRKQSTYTENKIFPFATMSDIRADLLKKARMLASNQREETHPWASMDDMGLLKSAGLYMIDKINNKEGLTLAAILIFGTDEAITNVLPHHKTDMILRKINTDRYDDREIIQTNLLDSYAKMMDFVKKHLNDPFYLEDDMRISLRNKIFREAVANSLIHREYSSAYIAKMVIQKDKVVFENANRPHGYGQIDPNNFTPYPKNPNIAKVFREIGYADELGSGVKNLHKYSRLYSGHDSEFVEGDVFWCVIPMQDTEQDIATTPQDTQQDTQQDSSKMSAIIDFCKEARSRREIQDFIGIKDREHFRTSLLKPLLDSGRLAQTIPDKPNSKYQKYITVKQ